MWGRTSHIAMWGKLDRWRTFLRFCFSCSARLSRAEQGNMACGYGIQSRDHCHCHPTRRYAESRQAGRSTAGCTWNEDTGMDMDGIARSHDESSSDTDLCQHPSRHGRCETHGQGRLCQHRSADSACTNTKWIYHRAPGTLAVQNLDHLVQEMLHAAQYKNPGAWQQDMG